MYWLDLCQNKYNNAYDHFLSEVYATVQKHLVSFVNLKNQYYLKSKEIVEKKKSIEQSLKVLNINNEILKHISVDFLNNLFIEEKLKTLEGSSLQLEYAAKEQELSQYFSVNQELEYPTNAENQMDFPLKLKNFETFFIDWANFFPSFNYIDPESSSVKISNTTFLNFYESLKNLHRFFFSNKKTYANFFLNVFFEKHFHYLDLTFFKFFRFTDENLKKNLIFQELLRILDKQDSFFLRNFLCFYDNLFFFFNFLESSSTFNEFLNFFDDILPAGLIKQFSLNFFDDILSRVEAEITFLNSTILDINSDIENSFLVKDSFYNFFYKKNLDKQDFSFLLDAFHKKNSNKVSSFFFNKIYDILNVVLHFKNTNDSFFFNKHTNI